jgi:ParB/RepB/Spo0J family partition protein
MQLEFHQLDRRWEHLRVRHPGRQRRLLASLADSGQQTPIVVVAAEGQADRYVVIDGYKRIAALEQLGRDTVEAVVWPMSEVAAVLLDRSLRLSEHETALEVGWLLAELERRFGCGLDELARRFDRSASWVSRRLALVEVLPEAIQQQVRDGKILAQVALKCLVPAAGRHLRRAPLRYAPGWPTVCGVAQGAARNPQTDSGRSRAIFQNAAASAGESSGPRGHPDWRRTVARSGDGGGDCEPSAAAVGGRRCHRVRSPAIESRAASDRAHSKPTPPHGRRNPTGEETAC